MLNLKEITKNISTYSLAGALLFSLNGCLDERPLPTDELITIFNSDMEKTNKLKPLDTMYVQLGGLKANAKHEINILDSDKNLITTTQVYTDDDGVVEALPVWYDVGLKKPDEDHPTFYVDSTTQSGVVMKSFYINVKDCYADGSDTDFSQAFFYILKKNDTAEEVKDIRTQEMVNITQYMRPKIYAVSSSGEMENAFEEQNSKYMDGTISDLTKVYLKVDGLPERIYTNDGNRFKRLEDNSSMDIYVVPFDKDGNTTSYLAENAIVKVTKTRAELLDGNATTLIWDINVTNPTNENNSYSVVLDIDQDGKYTKGIDISGDGISDVFTDGIDGLNTAGFIVKNTPANDPLPLKLTDLNGDKIASIPENPDNTGTNSKIYLSVENIAIAGDSVSAQIQYDQNGSVVKDSFNIDVKTPDSTDQVRYLKYIDSEKIFETSADFTNNIIEPTTFNLVISELNITTSFIVYPVDENTTTHISSTSDSSTLFDESGTENGNTKIFMKFGNVGYTTGSVYLFDNNRTFDENSTLANSILKKQDINVTHTGTTSLVFDLDNDGQKIINPTNDNGMFNIVVDYDNNGLFNDANDTKLNITIRDTSANNLPNVGYINIASNGYFNFDNHRVDSNQTSDYGYIDEFALDGSNTRGKRIRAIWNPYLKNKKRGGFYANYRTSGTGKESTYIDESQQVKKSPFNFGQQLDLYILNAETYPLKRSMSLQGKDLRGEPQTVTTQYSCSNGALMQSILDRSKMKEGKYYVILDINRNGILDDGVDYVDAVTQKGKTISEDDPNVAGFTIVKELTNTSTTWVKQYGTTSSEHTYAIASDTSGNILSVGCTYGTFDQNTSKGGHDGFIIKYDKDGNKLFAKELGTSGYDVVTGVSTTGTDIYLAGYTSGTFADETKAGSYDGFVAKYDKDGTQSWAKQFGTSGSDYIKDIVTDTNGNSYVLGRTYRNMEDNSTYRSKYGSYDCFVVKYDQNGIQKMVTQIGTSSSDYPIGITVDKNGNNVYVTGYTYGTFSGETKVGSYDGFVAKIPTDDLNATWIKQFGTSSYDYPKAVAVDSSNNIYITGYTYGTFSGENRLGSYDGFLVKYSEDGAQQFTKQFGTTSSDQFEGITIDTSDNIYVAGHTYGRMDSYNKFGSYDSVVIKFDTNGNQSWNKQFGTTKSDYTKGITTDGINVYVTGRTRGNFDHNDTNRYYYRNDGFVGKIKLTQ